MSTIRWPRDPGGVLLGALLGVMALLPTGPGYLGSDRVNYIDAGLTGLVLLWAALRIQGARSAGERPAGHVAGANVQRAWAVFLALAGGAALVGLAAENRISSAVFRAHATDSLSTLLWSESLVFDPFYPGRVWIVLARGLLTFWIVRDLCRHAHDPRARARTALCGWLAGFALVGALAVAQYLTEYGLHPFWVTANPTLTRAHATLDDPNSLASYLTLGVGLAWGMGLAAAPRSTRALLGFGFALLGVVAIVTTVSRAAWAALPLAVALTMAAAPPVAARALFPGVPGARRWARRALVGAAIIALALIGARAVVPELEASEPATPLAAAAMTIDPRTPLDEVLKGRLRLWKAALGMAADHPLTGVGLGRYPRLLPSYVAPEWAQPENAHGFVLQVLAEAGGIGLLACLIFLGTLLRSLGRATRGPEPGAASIAAGATVGVGAFLLTSVTGHPLLLSSGQILFAAALAAALGAATGAPSGVAPATPAPRGADRATRASLAAFAPTMVCALGVVVYLAAAARISPAPRQGTEWGYTWGLLPEEWGHFPESWGRYLSDRGFELDDPTRQPFRWSRERALLELAPAQGSTSCVLRFVSPLPARSGVAQQLVVRSGAHRETVSMERSEPLAVRIPLNAETLSEEGYLLVAIAVDPAFVPAELGASADSRRLGVHVLRPICER